MRYNGVTIPQNHDFQKILVSRRTARSVKAKCLPVTGCLFYLSPCVLPAPRSRRKRRKTKEEQGKPTKNTGNRVQTTRKSRDNKKATAIVLLALTFCDVFRFRRDMYCIGFLYVLIHVYIYTYIYIHIYTHIHAYIHTYTCMYTINMHSVRLHIFVQVSIFDGFLAGWGSFEASNFPLLLHRKTSENVPKVS